MEAAMVRWHIDYGKGRVIQLECLHRNGSCLRTIHGFTSDTTTTGRCFEDRKEAETYYLRHLGIKAAEGKRWIGELETFKRHIAAMQGADGEK